MTERIIATIDILGKVQLDAEGFIGNTCEAATKQLQAVLAGKEESNTYKPEYYAANESVEGNVDTRL